MIDSIIFLCHEFCPDAVLVFSVTVIFVALAVLAYKRRFLVISSKGAIPDPLSGLDVTLVPGMSMWQ